MTPALDRLLLFVPFLYSQLSLSIHVSSSAPLAIRAPAPVVVISVFIMLVGIVAYWQFSPEIDVVGIVDLPKALFLVESI